MNILFITHFIVGFMVSEITRYPYSVTFPYLRKYSPKYIIENIKYNIFYS